MEVSLNKCPKCGAHLERKKNKSGSTFIGCSAWKRSGCKYKRSDERVKTAVLWEDGYNWHTHKPEYSSIGSAPSFIDTTSIKDEAAKSLFLFKKNSTPKTKYIQLMCQAITKLLARGEYAYPTLGIEKHLIKTSKLENQPLPLDPSLGTLGYDHKLSLSRPALFRSLYNDTQHIERSETKSWSMIPFDSGREDWFFNHWIPTNLGPKAQHWFIPQAPIDIFLTSLGEIDNSQRRADFMLFVPGMAYVIELDGEDHKAKWRADKRRDELLNQYHVKTIRIPNHEIDKGDGPKLNELKKVFEAIIKPEVFEADELELARLLRLSCDATKLQYALIRALSKGFPLGQNNTVNVRIDAPDLPSELIKVAIKDLNELLSHYHNLFIGDASSPIQFNVNPKQQSDCSKLHVSFYRNNSPTDLTAKQLEADVVVSRGIVPSQLKLNVGPKLKKPKLVCDNNQAYGSLKHFLNYIFRKSDFREHQFEAIANVLRDKDTLTLLPTGAGKSIIYQLSGMLLPGVTIVVDPISALIDDQQYGLLSHGINRVAALRGSRVNNSARDEMMAAIAANQIDYILLSPERMLIQAFREYLTSMMEQTGINLAVIDEAHCLSQWGHDFRFAYLRLSENLRRYCSDKLNGKPKILAMTGTASRTVLKEMIAEIGISLEDDESIIKPTSFNRSELTFSVKYINHGGHTFPELNETLQSLPRQLSKDQETFFDLNGGYTNSGIIFTPYAGGQEHGLLAVRKAVMPDKDVPIGIFAGTPPRKMEEGKWEQEKTEHARKFKENKEPILIATKAFGMGVDKPNIRWTIHLGMPQSIEAFYQEAGRAGRDRHPSHCSILFSETDPSYTDQLLDPSISLDEMNKRYKDRKPRDDIDRAARFHLGAFSSIAEELKIIEELLKKASNCDNHTVALLNYDLPKSKQGDDKERYKKIQKRMGDLERALVRMSYCGLVDDYTKNYSSNELTVSFRQYSYKHSRMLIEEYVKKVQPARLRSIENSIIDIASESAEDQPKLFCKIMIDFTYDIIERSRRRMMFEAVQMARYGISDEYIRNRVIEYLQEGAHSARLIELAESTSLDFTDWFELVDSVSEVEDAEELRGDISRILESYSDHAGLLFSLALTEA